MKASLLLSFAIIGCLSILAATTEVQNDQHWPRDVMTTFNAPHHNINTVTWRTCYYTGDPHLGGFDHLYQDCHFTGELLMFKCKLAGMCSSRIHVYEALFRGPPAYNQMVAFQAKDGHGTHVFQAWVNRNHNPSRLSFSFNGRNIDVSHYHQGRSERRGPFHIRVTHRHPTWIGMEVMNVAEQVMLQFYMYTWHHSGQPWGHIDVYIKIPPQKYWGHTHGWCGTLGIRQWRTRDDRFTNHLGQCESYKIPFRSHRSLFRNRPEAPPPAPPVRWTPPQPSPKLVAACGVARNDRHALKDCLKDGIFNKHLAELTTARVEEIKIHRRLMVQAIKKNVPRAARDIAPDDEFQKWPVCITWGDPHVVSFRGKRREDLQRPGEYVLWRNKRNKDRVHVFHQYGHNRASPFYNTKVAIRCGDEVLRLELKNYLHQHRRGEKSGFGVAMYFNHRRVPTIGFQHHRVYGNFGVKNSNAQTFDITTIRDVNVIVRVYVHHTRGGRVAYMDVHLRVRPSMYRTSQGVCGNINGDWVSRQGEGGPLWKVGQTWLVEKKSESLFDKWKPPPPPELKQHPLPVDPKLERKCAKTLRGIRFRDAQEKQGFVRQCAVDLKEGIPPKETRSIVQVTHIKPVTKVPRIIIPNKIPKTIPVRFPKTAPRVETNGKVPPTKVRPRPPARLPPRACGGSTVLVVFPGPTNNCEQQRGDIESVYLRKLADRVEDVLATDA